MKRCRSVSCLWDDLRTTAVWWHAVFISWRLLLFV